MQGQSLFTQFPKLKIVIIAVAILILGAIIAIFVHSSIYSTTITVTAAPHSANITLNDRPIRNRAMQRLRPGEYTIRVSQEGFIEEKYTITLESGDNIELMFALSPEDGNYQWYIDNPEDALILEEIVGGEIEGLQNQVARDFPILGMLPHRTDDFELNLWATPSEDDPRLGLSLYVFAAYRGAVVEREEFDRLSAEARAWLSEQGLKPDQYFIEPIQTIIEHIDF